MNIINFYQLLIKTDLSSNLWSTVSNLDVLMISEQSNSATVVESSNELSKRLYNYDMIEFLDLTDSVLKKSLNLFYKPVTELYSTKVDAESKIIFFVFK